MKVLNEGVHSGDASGVVPSSFRLLRQLLSRIEDQDTGRILIDGMNVEIPAERLNRPSAPPKWSIPRSSRSSRWSTACVR